MEGVDTSTQAGVCSVVTLSLGQITQGSHNQPLSHSSFLYVLPRGPPYLLPAVPSDFLFLQTGCCKALAKYACRHCIYSSCVSTEPGAKWNQFGLRVITHWFLQEHHNSHMGKPFLIILELQQWSSSLAWFANKGKVKSNKSITHGNNHIHNIIL